ncbi:MAG: 50S ribosomal protein L21 [Chloroflexota bacterium]
MYAVIETGGKQYRVEVGTELEVELLDAEPGVAITLDRILLVADGDEAAIGRPVVADATVEAQVVRRDRGPKLISFKYRPKARRRVTKGHRQELTVLRISDIRFGGKSAAEAQRKLEQDALTERQRLEAAAAKQAAADAALADKLAQAKAKADKPAGSPADAGATPTKAKAKARTKAPPAQAATPAADDAPVKPAAPRRTRATKKDE